MAWENQTAVREFVFKGFTDNPSLQATLFVVFLLIYATTIVGNLGIISVVWLNSNLHTPMYFFISNLSFLDLCYPSVVTPKMLLILSAVNKTISFAGCLVQLYFYAAFVITECFLLASMAYDRYVAICHPLHYATSMSHKVCFSLLSGSYAVGFFSSVILTGSVLRGSFCGPNVINHFFCDGPPLFELACSDPSFNQVLLIASGALSEVTSTTILLLSYGHILLAILRTRSVKGKNKAFGTCASHLACVTIFHGTLLFMYLRPISSYNMDRDKVASVFYTVVTPMLNPFIYSLRNQEVKSALRRTIGRSIFSVKAAKGLRVGQ